MKQAIVLCSGGIDSVVTSYLVKSHNKYSQIRILFFNYSQNAINLERKYSKICSKEIGADFIEIKLNNVNNFSDSLINKPKKIEKIENLKDTKKESSEFYVPCRNSIFINYALAIAEYYYVKNKTISDIFVGFKCEGNESYPDTTISFVNAINNLSRVSCSYPFKLIAPLIKKDKEDIITLGKKLGVNFGKTISCYMPKREKHCGICLACELRKAGFYWAGLEDKTDYIKN